MRTLNSTGFPLGFREAARRSSRSLEKFGTQDPHQKERDLSAVGPGPPEPAFLAKSHLFITANRAPVGRKDPEVDTGEPQRRKSVAHKGAYRVGAEALIPVGLLAYANAELRVAAPPGDVVQLDVSDQQVAVRGDRVVLAVAVA